MLSWFGQDFDFLVNTSTKENQYPRQRPVLETISTVRPFSERVLFFEKQYVDLLKPYDAILTADMIYQKGGNFLAQNQAARRVEPYLEAWWYHWIHSAWVEPPEIADYPELLRHEPMMRSTLVYQNSSEREGIARQYHVKPEQVAVVYNPKDIRSFNYWNGLSWKISALLDFPLKDVIQVLPFCATRMDSKGIDTTVKAFAALKRMGVPVALVLACGHAWKVPEDIAAKKEWIESQGLVEGVDFLWTHDHIDGQRHCPREVVSDLFGVSNLFVYASWREVCPQVLLEARTSGCLLVVNRHTQPLAEFSGQEAIYFDGTTKTPGKHDYTEGDLQECTYRDEFEYFDFLAAEIIDKLPSKKHQWLFCYENIWNNQMGPLLYGRKRDDRRVHGDKRFSVHDMDAQGLSCAL